MTPRDNVTPVKLEGAVRITDSATLTLGNGVDTTLADLTAASQGSVWLNSNNSCAGTSNCEYRVNSLLLNDGDVYLSAQTAAPATTNGIYNTLTTNELSGSGNFYLHTNVAGSGAINWSSTTTPLVILKSLFRIPASAHSLTTR